MSENKDAVNGVHVSSDEANYVWETNEEVLNSLEKFKDQKLGFMTHFGMFTQLGMVESWALCDCADEHRWSQEGIDWTDIETFKKQYIALNESFNPVRFDPEQLVKFIKSFGANYFIIPTKHHDGFCLWDTKYTKYNCVESSPYKKDVYNQLRQSCKDNDLIIGAYLSKADWASPYYWEPEKILGITDRHPTYDTKKDPEKWQKFVDFTHNQIREITEGPNKVDILWLDAGWVRPGRNQDIDIDGIAKIARRDNKGTIVVDRACGGINENYITPEQSIPPNYLNVPWESCISLGPPFAYSYNDKYRDEFQLGHLFSEIIAKGGNLVLNVAFQPDGRFPEPAAIILSRFSKWYNQHKNDIVGSRPVEPYYMDKVGYMKNKDGKNFILIPNEKDSIIRKYKYITTDNIYSKATLRYQGNEYNLPINYEQNRLRFEFPAEIIYNEAPICHFIYVE